MNTTKRRNKTIKLTAKQKAFADELLANPKTSGQDAALKAYGKEGKTISDNTARAIASENLTKPNIMAYLEAHAVDAEIVLFDVMKTAQEQAPNSAGHAAVAVSAAKDILDRVHGKATQKTEINQKTVVVNIDLTGKA